MISWVELLSDVQMALLLFRIVVWIYSVFLSEVALHPGQIYCTIFMYSIL